VSARSIAEALGKAERDSKGWKCLCPIHDDHNPSLSIRDVGGNVLVHCHRCGSDGQAKLVEELKRRGAKAASVTPEDRRDLRLPRRERCSALSEGPLRTEKLLTAPSRPR